MLPTRLLRNTMSSSTSPLRTFIVRPKDLHAALKTSPPPPTHPRIIPLSAAWFLPNASTTGHASFKSAHIPQSLFFDLDKICDPDSPYPHMLPTPKHFAASMTALGVTKADTLVVYDAKEVGVFAAPRVAWMLRLFGHERVHLLDNFRAWVAEGLPVSQGEEDVSRGAEGAEEYPVPEIDVAKAVTFQEVKRLVNRSDVQIIDARPEGRFKGVDKEPREGISSGHIPGAVSVPFSMVLSEDGGFGKPDLREVLEKRGVNLDQNVKKVVMCGTGVTACVVGTALKEAGLGEAQVYDGSWTEWAMRVTPEEGLIVKDIETK